MPACAVLVQQKLGGRRHCPAFDLSAACAGFIFGLGIADRFVRAGSARHVLVIGVELLSPLLDWEDRTACVPFGDGAGAVVVGPNTSEDARAGRGIFSTHAFTDRSLAESLLERSGWFGMDAHALWKDDALPPGRRNTHALS